MPSTDALRLTELIAETEGPWVSLLLPTHRAGAETTGGPILLKNLVREASAALPSDDEREWLDETTTPLLEDWNFWQNQTDGLALFLSGEATHIRHLSISPEPEANVGPLPHLLPLVPVMGQPQHFTILQLSLNQVRVFEVAGEQIEEAELGPVPSSVEDLSTDRDNQTHLQFSAQGGGRINYHGHGTSEANDDARRDRFLRHVARGLEERAASHGRYGTLFIAATQDMAERFARLSGQDHLSERVIAGSADGLTAPQIFERAQDQLAAYAERRRESHQEILGQRNAQGRMEIDPNQILEAARTGRVESLYVGVVDDAERDRVNAAIIETLRNSGEVHPASDSDAQGVRATLRY